MRDENIGTQALPVAVNGRFRLDGAADDDEQAIGRRRLVGFIVAGWREEGSEIGDAERRRLIDLAEGGGGG